MSRLLIGFLIVLSIHGLTRAQLAISFELIQKIFDWGMKIYNTIEQIQNPDKSQSNLKIIMKQLNQISSKIDTIETHLDIKLDAILDTLLADIRLENNLNRLKRRLRHCFFKINEYFDKSRQYVVDGAYNNQTLKNFAHKALWSSGSVPDLLDDMYEVFFSGSVEDLGFLSFMLEHTMLNILHDCNTYISPQQKIYYIYIQVLVTEIKALTTQLQTFMIQQYFESTLYNYTSELNTAKTYFERHLKNFHTLFSQTISQYPQQIRRCEGKPPVRGDNFIELVKFSHIAVLDTNVVIKHGCLVCPGKSILADLSRRMNSTISNCKKIGTTLTTCSAESNFPHEYLWWNDGTGNHYGPKTICTNEKKIHGGFLRTPTYGGAMGGFMKCKICACSVQTNGAQSDHSTIWRISVTDQYSDFFNNKVVTGVKFVIQDNALHLQIRQGRFTHSAMIYGNNQWKNLELGYYSSGTQQMKGPMFFEPLRHDRKTLYLDDIKAPSGYAVTGVKFKLVNDSVFMLQIYVSQFELDSGKLFPFGGSWIDATTHPMNPKDYEQKRSEINMGKSDDPTRSSEFKYDLQSNKLIKFTHTDIDKDAGQTTIPLIDSQSVETEPPFPLGGIGISFRGRDGFGGYVAPRIYTFSVKECMRVPYFFQSTQANTSITSSNSHDNLFYKNPKPEVSMSLNEACC